MKRHTSFLLAFIFGATTLLAQPFNHETQTEKGSPMLLGKINKEGFSSKDYEWFSKNYDTYTTDSEAISSIKNNLNDYTIKAFMGTWCGDSKREVPRFYKVMEKANFPLERFSLIALDRKREAYKQSPGGEHEGMNIHRVPTFIIYKNGKEINRIVEEPVSTLEGDLKQILDGNYTSSYYGVTIVDETIKEMGVEKFRKKSKKIARQLENKLKNMYELNTYSSVLFLDNREEEAIAVAKLNLLLFPDEARAYESLGVKLAQTGSKEEAITYLEKAIALDPENKRYKSSLASITVEN